MAPEMYCYEPRLCPWCHARMVLKLYRRLAAGPLQDLGGKLLVQARISFTSKEMGLSPEEDKKIKEVCRYDSKAWWYQGNWTNFLRRLWTSQVTRMQQMSRRLRKHAFSLGSVAAWSPIRWGLLGIANGKIPSFMN